MLPPEPVRSNRTRLVWAGGALVLLVALFLGLLLTRGTDGAQAAPPGSIAVLPFRAIGDTSLTVISEGLMEELTTALIRENGLVVRSTSRVHVATANGGDVEAIGNQLNVLYVLDGGIQRGSGRARITLRLVRASDGIAIWAGSYDIPLNPGLEELQRVTADVSTVVAKHLANR